MANSWLRLWHDMPNDPKWRTIARSSGQPVSLVLSVYLHVLVNASNATERGRTQNLISEDIASALDVETEQVDAVLSAMQGRVLDQDRVSGWENRQPVREDGAAERAKAWRESKKSAKSCNANATERWRTQCERNANATERPDTDTDTDTDIKPPTPLRGADVRFDRFWSAYPRKKAKDAARKAWAKRRPDDSMLASMLAAIAVQSKSAQWLKDGGQFVPYPATWLNDGCWQDDEPVGSESSVGSYV